MMFLGIGIIRTEKCWPNSPTYSTYVGVLRGWGRAQITVDILGREAKKVEKHCTRRSKVMMQYPEVVINAVCTSNLDLHYSTVFRQKWSLRGYFIKHGLGFVLSYSVQWLYIKMSTFEIVLIYMFSRCMRNYKKVFRLICSGRLNLSLADTKGVNRKPRVIN